MKRSALPTALAAALAALSPFVGQLHAQAQDTLVAPGAVIERVWTGGHFLEGPAVAPDGTVYFSDIAMTEGAANLAFGRGPESDVLYLAATTSLYRVRVKTRGWHVGSAMP